MQLTKDIISTNLFRSNQDSTINGAYVSNTGGRYRTIINGSNTTTFTSKIITENSEITTGCINPEDCLIKETDANTEISLESLRDNTRFGTMHREPQQRVITQRLVNTKYTIITRDKYGTETSCQKGIDVNEYQVLNGVSHFMRTIFSTPPEDC